MILLQSSSFHSAFIQGPTPRIAQQPQQQPGTESLRGAMIGTSPASTTQMADLLGLYLRLYHTVISCNLTHV